MPSSNIVCALLQLAQARSRTDGQARARGQKDAEDFLKMANDVSWFGCFDDGMTPEQAVAEYKRKALD